MTRTLAAAAAAAAVALSAPARGADDDFEPPASGFSAALRLGYAFPLGSADATATLSSIFSGSVPIWIDAGWRLDPSWFVGAFFQYGFGIVSSRWQSPTCTISGVSCSGSVIRFGGEAIWTPSPQATFAPWLGAGIGYEISRAQASALGATQARTTLEGFEFLNLQLGADYRLSPTFAVGPYVALSLAEYSEQSEVGSSGSIADRKLHEWLQLGLRGVFDL